MLAPFDLGITPGGVATSATRIPGSYTRGIAVRFQCGCTLWVMRTPAFVSRPRVGTPRKIIQRGTRCPEHRED